MYTEGLNITHHTMNAGTGLMLGLSSTPTPDSIDILNHWFTNRGFGFTNNYDSTYGISSNNKADVKSLSDETRIAKELEALVKKGYEKEQLDGGSDSQQYYQVYFDRKKNALIFGGAVMVAAYIGRYDLVEKLLDAGFPTVQRVMLDPSFGNPFDTLNDHSKKTEVIADRCFFTQKTEAGLHIDFNTAIGIDYIVYVKNDMPDALALKILDNISTYYYYDSVEAAIYDGADPDRLIDLMCHTNVDIKSRINTVAMITQLRGLLIPDSNPFAVNNNPFYTGPGKGKMTGEDPVITGLRKKAYNRYLKFQKLYIDHIFANNSTAGIKKFIINMSLVFDSVIPLHGTANSRTLLALLNSHFSQRKQLLKKYNEGILGDELWMTCFYEIPIIDALIKMMTVRLRSEDPHLGKAKNLMAKYCQELASMRPDSVTGTKLYRRWRSKFHDKFNCYMEEFDTNDAWGFVKKKLGVEMETKLDVDTIRYLSSYTSQLADELRRPEEDDDRMPFLVDMSIQNAHKHLRRHIDNLCSIKVTYEDPLEKKTAKKDYMKLLDNLIDIGDEDLVEAYYQKGVITKREFDSMIQSSMETGKRELVPFLMANMD